MANGHGGTRPNAGRKRKSLSEKLLDGNRPPTKKELIMCMAKK